MVMVIQQAKEGGGGAALFSGLSATPVLTNLQPSVALARTHTHTHKHTHYWSIRAKPITPLTPAVVVEEEEEEEEKEEVKQPWECAGEAFHREASFIWRSKRN